MAVETPDGRGGHTDFFELANLATREVKVVIDQPRMELPQVPDWVVAQFTNTEGGGRG